MLTKCHCKQSQAKQSPPLSLTSCGKDTFRPPQMGLVPGEWCTTTQSSAAQALLRAKISPSHGPSVQAASNDGGAGCLLSLGCSWSQVVAVQVIILVLHTARLVPLSCDSDFGASAKECGPALSLVACPGSSCRTALRPQLCHLICFPEPQRLPTLVLRCCKVISARRLFQAVQTLRPYTAQACQATQANFTRSP